MMMNIQQAQILLDTEDVDKLVVLLNHTFQLESFIHDLAKTTQLSAINMEYQVWYQMATFYQKVVDLYDGFFLFINIVIVAIVLLSITNTMIVTVMERTYEIGTTRAMGVKVSSIIRQFTYEALMLSIISAAMGILLGIGVASYITSLEIMMSPPPGSSQGFPLMIKQVPETWLYCVVGVAIVAVLATFIPARNAAKKNIVDALRHA
jgi:putative ABC transport system permease protein